MATCGEFTQEQSKLRRLYTAIYQDLVDIYGFGGVYKSVKWFAGIQKTATCGVFSKVLGDTWLS